MCQDIREDTKHSLQKRSPIIIKTLINATKKKTCFLILDLFCVQLIG